MLLAIEQEAPTILQPVEKNKQATFFQFNSDTILIGTDTDISPSASCLK